MYSSIKGWHTCRSITKRLSTKPSRLGRYAGQKKELRLVFEDSVELGVLERYVADWCHKADPARFQSVGIPPSEGEVERSLGWTPVVRDPEVRNSDLSGKGKKKVVGVVLSDEQLQRKAFEEDLKTTVEKGTLSWRKKCLRNEKRAEKAAKKAS